MNSNPTDRGERSSRSRDQKIIIMLFYPYTLAMIVAGFAAFVFLIIGFSILIAATIALCFFSFCASILYFITKPAIKMMNMRGMFLSFVITADVFAVLSICALLLTYFA